MAARKKIATSSVRELGERLIDPVTADSDRAWTAGPGLVASAEAVATRPGALFNEALGGPCCATARDVAGPVATLSAGNRFEAADVSNSLAATLCEDDGGSGAFPAAVDF